MNNATSTKHPLGKTTLPNTWADFDYYDKKFVETFYCKRIFSNIYENLFFDSVGKETYTESKIWGFDCVLLPIVNDKIRILQKVEFKESYEADFINTSKTGLGLKKKDLSHNYLRTVTLTSTSDFRFKLITRFDETDLKDQRVYSKLFHSKDRIIPTKYNNWNFTGSATWDSNAKNAQGKYMSFWYSVNTTFLAETVPFKIGSQQV